MLAPNWGKGVNTAGMWNCRLTAKNQTLNRELITNNLSNLKVHLNSESYPYYKMNVDLSKNSFAHQYEMYTWFQYSYYNRQSQPL